MTGTWRCIPPTRTGRVEAMSAHVQALLAHHDLTSGTHSRGGSANRHDRTSATHAFASACRAYVISERTGRGAERPRPTTRCTRSATSWALRNARTWAVTETFAANVRACLVSYRTWAERRGATMHGARAGCPALPPLDHVFWRLLEHGRLEVNVPRGEVLPWNGEDVLPL